MSDRKTFVIPLAENQIKNILICLELARADMEQYKMIYEDKTFTIYDIEGMIVDKITVDN